ncbi:MAG: hypothetical protein JSU80_15005 [Deltaproteobacteria bacterium]|nr:MAG: hypothetical protein JSU80_15005 [Deltaproteobacteria bacterium]
MFLPFFYQLRDQGIPVSLKYVLEFYQALKKGLAPDLDRLFLLMRLIFVKKVEHFDVFEQAFAAYFFGTEGAEGTRFSRQEWENTLFRRWLEEEIGKGSLPDDALERLSLSELLQRFWEVALEQRGEHQGGATWVGTGGTSHFGHSGGDQEGIRVYGDSLYGSALKVIEGRRYVDYTASATLRAENLRQVLAALKHMAPAGPPTELDVDETIDQSCRNGGEIELVFRRELKDRIELMVLLDNGGASMRPYLDLVKLVFGLMRDQFKDLDYYYFHNCIYGCVYSDPQRLTPYPIYQMLRRDPETRVIIIGDANMAPAELMLSDGAMDYFSKVRVPGRDWLWQVRNYFGHSVWLNPIPRNRWPQESQTIYQIGEIFPMEDLTLAGIRRSVEWLNTGAPPRKASRQIAALRQAQG